MSSRPAPAARPPHVAQACRTGRESRCRAAKKGRATGAIRSRARAASADRARAVLGRRTSCGFDRSGARGFGRSGAHGSGPPGKLRLWPIGQVGETSAVQGENRFASKRGAASRWACQAAAFCPGPAAQAGKPPPSAVPFRRVRSLFRQAQPLFAGCGPFSPGAGLFRRVRAFSAGRGPFPPGAAPFRRARARGRHRPALRPLRLFPAAGIFSLPVVRRAALRPCASPRTGAAFPGPRSPADARRGQKRGEGRRPSPLFCL